MISEDNTFFSTGQNLIEIIIMPSNENIKGSNQWLSKISRIQLRSL